MKNIAQIGWACRRGMRELDIMLMPFFQHEFESLSEQQQQTFIRLLDCDDPDLFNWLMQHGEPDDEALNQIIQLIRQRNLQREPSGY
ncbi:MAG: FAD assembly factor SdhE [Candidatus Erwinia impunctatus]|nr:FAD assembly factor SdhE [Culicoides impunctatus]